MTQPAAPVPSSTPRRRRWPWVVLGVVVVLAVVLVVVDRVAASVAEDKVATTVSESLVEYETTAGSTSVRIRGFPFLTQAASGSFDQVDVTLNEVMVRGFALDELTAKLTDVDVPRSALTGGDAGDIVAGRVEAAGRLDPGQLGSALNLPDLDLRADGDRLRATGTLTLRGVAIDVDASLRPYVADGRIAAEIVELSTSAGELSALARTAVEGYVAAGVAVPELPLGAQLTDVMVADGAVVLIGDARDVALTR